MAGTPEGSDKPRYACQCLNVRIRPTATNLVATDLVEDPNFISVFVGEEGITVAHPQVTVRTRTRGVPIAGSSRFSRYTTITCLLCHLLVYRVCQTYSADVEGKDGPLLPTEDWVERDILMSLSGWVEVHKGCLTGAAVEQATSSADYSKTFDLLLPPTISPSSSPGPIFERPPSRSSVSPPPPPPKFFANVRPVFLPPPFTPSHPVFTYLSSYAARESQAVRDAAEDYMTQRMKFKTSEIENTDAELRRKVDTLWRTFREGLTRIQLENNVPSARRLSTPRSRERPALNGIDPSSSGTPIPIREFVPTSVSRARSSSPPAPRVSALSASLATSSFHHPRARATATSPPPASHRTPSIVSTASSRSGSSTLGTSAMAVPKSIDATNIHKVRRNIKEGVDTATSYRFFVTLEEDMARRREERQASDRSQPAPDQTGAAPTPGNTNVNGDDVRKQPSGSQANVEKSTPPPEIQVGEGELSPSRGREKSKGKRRVTFDVNPAVVTIKREVLAEKEEEEALAKEEDRDMIFDLQDLEGDNQGSPSQSRPTLQLVEQPAAPARPRKPRPQNVDTLSSSFSGLRPTSLPAPSHIRPPRSQHGSDLSSPSMMLSLPKPALPLRAESEDSSVAAGPSEPRPQAMENSDEPTNAPPQVEEVLKLIAADSPSHRGARTDSKAWQTFARRQSGNLETVAIPEEGEDEGTDASGFAVPDIMPRHKKQESQDIFVGSLPIPIKLGKQKEQLSLASYQPKTVVTQTAPAPTVNQKQPSSTTIRKAIYAQRDRSRSLDPGPLDFPIEDDEEEQQEEETEEREEIPLDTSSAGGRGRKAALKILKARSEIPEAGMWRSLAS
ncbi:hypothetical protein D9615_000670 [Tricholomella constricta]|uniref:Uncharacterized protein n=1 Tax=Tricholomella constricta TaxID=117010 RepID=A0A8H5MCB7_9AGAR|nr:hypothetical protein D9615_000670 [Tricholomella constricta]